MRDDGLVFKDGQLVSVINKNLELSYAHCIDDELSNLTAINILAFEINGLPQSRILLQDLSQKLEVMILHLTHSTG